MTRAVEVSRETRDERIRDNLDLVDREANALVARAVRSGHDEWNDYRADMESAGRLALVEGAASFEGGGFRPWARIVIRNAMLDEVRNLANLTRTRDDDGGRTWRERDVQPVEFVELPTSHDSERAILNRIDRARAMDRGKNGGEQRWRMRERRILGDPVDAWVRTRRGTEPNILCSCSPRANCKHVRVYKARRVEGRGLADTARRTGVSPFHVPTVERDALELLVSR